MIKNILLTFSLLFLGFNSYTQDNLGLITGNYSGISGIRLQPANVADNRYKFDFNIISASINFDNNYLGFSRDYFLNNRFSFKDFNNYNDFKTKILVENDLKGDKAYFNLTNRLQAPMSFLLSTGKQSGIALNIQSRTAITMKDVNPDFAKQVYEFWKYPGTYGKNYDLSNMQINAMNWLEVGVTYGKVLVDADQHFLKFGVTAKYLGGISSWNLKANNLTVRADNDSLFTGSGNVSYSHSESNISTNINSSYRPDASSWGGDLGFVYEFRARINKFLVPKYNKNDDYTEETQRRDKNKYSAKLGVSLLDVGVLNYKSAPLARNFNLDVNKFNIGKIDIRNLSQFDTLIAKNSTYTSAAGQEYSVAMPTALSAQLDLHILNGFYVNAMLYKPFTSLSRNATYKIQTPNYYAVTPRWESRMAGVYLPISMNSHQVINAGATVRLGPLFIGTSNMLTLLKKDNIQSADLHAGLKVPIAFGKPSKTAEWFKKFTSSDEKTIENEEVELKRKTTPQQPIQIIINNYNYPGAEQHSQGSDIKLYELNLGDENPKIIIEENKINGKELNDLQQQIEYLRKKLNQKEEIIDELEKSNILGDPSGSSKKKVDSLIYNYQHETFSLAKNNVDEKNLTLVERNKLTSALLTQLDSLELKDLQLQYRIENNNSKLQAQIEHHKGHQEEALLMKQQLEWLTVKALKLDQTSQQNTLSRIETRKRPAQIEAPKLSTLSSPFPTYTEEVVSIQKTQMEKPITNQDIENKIASENANVKQATRSSQTAISKNSQIDMDQLLTKKEAALLLSKKDAELLMTKKEYQVLLNEITNLKSELKSSNAQKQLNTIAVAPNINKPKGSVSVIVDTTYRTLAQANLEPKVQIIRDTIYIDKPVEKIVDRIVRDTIVNTVVKNNTVTKVEEKTVFTDNERTLILNAEPEVILFDVGSFMIKSVYFPKLISLSNKLKKYPELKVNIQGHTDNTGSDEKNKILSETRAKSVKVFLLNHGVSKSAFIIDAYGAENPLAENKTNQGKSQNRRVEVKIVE